jgi:hypothetical protein
MAVRLENEQALIKNYGLRRLIRRQEVLGEITELRARAMNGSFRKRPKTEKRINTLFRTAELLGADKEQIKGALLEAHDHIPNRLC